MKRDSAQRSTDEFLRQGFHFIHRHIGLIFLDLLWKLIWLVLTLAELSFLAVWFVSKFQAVEWVDRGNRATNTAAAFVLVREFWAVHHTEILGSLAIVFVLSLMAWFILEAAFRSKLHSAPRRGEAAWQPREARARQGEASSDGWRAGVVGWPEYPDESFQQFYPAGFALSPTPSASSAQPRFPAEKGNASFLTFLLSNILKCVFIATAGLALAAICFGRYYGTPISDWQQLWPDTRGAALISIVTIAGLGFLLTILDTLVRNDALALLGTDLFRVTGLIGILLLFETMISGSCATLIGLGFLNTAGLNSAMAMLGITVLTIGCLNILHSYLLLVRYSAVVIMRQNVVEI